MERQVDLRDISDGRLYGREDMVRAGCGDCRGCSACCQGMGASLKLDPLDVDRICKGLVVLYQKMRSMDMEVVLIDQELGY